MLTVKTLFRYLPRGRAALLPSLVAVALMSACSGSSNKKEIDSLAQTDQPAVTPQQPVEGTTTVIDGVEENPTVPEALPTFPGQITDVVLVTGQSNALGADTEFDAELDKPQERVFAFTNEGWKKADLHQIWDQNWHPRNDPDTDPSNNFGFHFAKKVASRRPQRVVGFILVSAPGAAISTWDYESEFYLSIRNRVIAALNQLPSKANIDGILWHQGESDWADTPYYENKLAELINNFRSESWFSSDKPFICGETASSPLNRILMGLNNDGDAWTGCVEGNGLPTVADQVHFTADGLRTIGTRYATKYLQMTEQ